MAAGPDVLSPAAAWRHRYFWWSDSALAAVSLNTLHFFDLAASGRTIWWLNATIVLSALWQHPAVASWARRGARVSAGVVWRNALAEAGLVAAMSYLTGWGPILGIGFIIVATLTLRRSGSRSSGPVLVASVAATVCGQVGIALGWVHTYLPASTAQAVGALGAVSVVIAIRELSTTTAEREKAERERHDSDMITHRNEERFRTLVQDSGDVIVLIDGTGHLTYVSSAVEHVMGYEPQEYIAKSGTGELLHPDDRPVAAAMNAAILGGARIYEAEMRGLHADGSWHWHEVVARNLLDHPAVGTVVYNHRDITERKRLQQRLAHDASHDALTGLHNRLALIDALAAVCDSSAPGLGAVLYLDLDGFKQVNDELGHAAGDQLLRAVSAVLSDCVLGADTVGRLGGDEFAIVLHTIHSGEDAVAVASRVTDRLTEELRIGDQLVRARASIGIALCVPGTLDTTQALHRADVAMYHAKRNADKGWQVYVEGMQDYRTDAAALEEDLRRALLNDELHVLYQPVIDLETSLIIGMEALVRWQHPDRGLLLPLTFVPLAEQTGLIGQLGAGVLRRACTELGGWQRAVREGPRLTLAVNISPVQLQHATIVAEFREILTSAGVDPHDLILELTESALVDYQEVASVLQALRASGIRIALDDFGTGNASLQYLTNFPVDILKIDTCFVARLDRTAEGAAVVEVVLRLGDALHLGVIAEGVETQAQAAELTLRGCRFAQGFHFHPAVDAGTMGRLVGDSGRQGSGTGDGPPADPLNAVG
ncbi:MAG TPA: EAL domain-containing protein [Actinoplanes sp.]|nr:EAL domain-containing protein [Actinoplanes sp.]